MTSPLRCDRCENVIDAAQASQYMLCADCLRLDDSAAADHTPNWQEEAAEANERSSCDRGPDCGGECYVAKEEEALGNAVRLFMRASKLGEVATLVRVLSLVSSIAEAEFHEQQMIRSMSDE